jgi:hypothetical protein
LEGLANEREKGVARQQSTKGDNNPYNEQDPMKAAWKGPAMLISSSKLQGLDMFLF